MERNLLDVNPLCFFIYEMKSAQGCTGRKKQDLTAGARSQVCSVSHDAELNDNLCVSEDFHSVLKL